MSIEGRQTLGVSHSKLMRQKGRFRTVQSGGRLSMKISSLLKLCLVEAEWKRSTEEGGEEG